MRKINVVTTFSNRGYQVYGKHMLRTFAWGWPKDVRPFVFYEGDTIPDNAPEFWVSLDADPDRARFMASHKDQPHNHPHAYLNMPVRFSHKVWAMTSPAVRDCDWLIWLDADIETTQPITQELLDSILKPDVLGVYLGRRWWSHTETGFLAFRMCDSGKKFLDDLRKVYTDNTIMTLHNKTDCAAFDYVRQVYEGKGHKFYDLGEGHKGPEIDVMAKSVLGPYLWHFKGDFRKLKQFGDVA